MRLFLFIYGFALMVAQPVVLILSLVPLALSASSGRLEAILILLLVVSGPVLYFLPAAKHWLRVTFVGYSLTAALSLFLTLLSAFSDFYLLIFALHTFPLLVSTIWFYLSKKDKDGAPKL